MPANPPPSVTTTLRLRQVGALFTLVGRPSRPVRTSCTRSRRPAAAGRGTARHARRFRRRRPGLGTALVRPTSLSGPSSGQTVGVDAETVRAMLLRNLGRAADDPVGSHDMYDDEAVLEFPQSGERFEGVANI